jgi:hypothetical protein
MKAFGFALNIAGLNSSALQGFAQKPAAMLTTIGRIGKQ